MLIEDFYYVSHLQLGPFGHLLSIVGINISAFLIIGDIILLLPCIFHDPLPEHADAYDKAEGNEGGVGAIGGDAGNGLKDTVY